MSTDETLDKLLGALAHPVRRQALAFLNANEELCVCELMSSLGVTQSRMSRHMSTLKAIGLVLERRDAQWVRYRRNPNTPAAVARIVDRVLDATPKKRGLRHRIMSTPGILIDGKLVHAGGLPKTDAIAGWLKS